jgi:hypothetical protein
MIPLKNEKIIVVKYNILLFPIIMLFKPLRNPRAVKLIIMAKFHTIMIASESVIIAIFIYNNVE